MQPSPQSQAGCSSAIPLLLALIVLIGVLSILSLLTLGAFGIMVAIAGGLVVVVGLQYLLWGWWLGPHIARLQREKEDGQQAEDD
jgi:hypothetical protein